VKQKLTLIELLAFFTMVGIGTLFAARLYPAGGWWLAVPGFVAGFLLLPGLLSGYIRYRKWAYCGDDLMPPCVCGAREFKAEIDSKNVYEVCLACGKRFEKNRDCVFLLANDIRKPYMKLVKYQGWIPSRDVSE